MGPADDGLRRREAGAGDLVADPDGAQLGSWADGWKLRAARLTELDAALAGEPDRLDLLVARAQLVDELGRRDEALAAYAAVLRRDATHYAAMMRFGALLTASGDPAGAATVFAEAVRRHGEQAAPHVCLGTLLADAGRNDEALAAYERAVARDPGQREAQRGIAIVLERERRLDEAERRWRTAFPNGSIETSPYRGPDRSPYRALFLTSAVGGNVPLQHVIDERRFAALTLIAESAPPEIELPPHDVAFNAVGDADRCARALDAVARIERRTAARVLNPAERVLATTRERNAERFARLAGVVSPEVRRFPREELRGDDAARRLAAAGFGWPLLLRSPGYHTGEHFVRVDEPEALAAAVAQLPGEHLLALAFVDTRGADGSYRKYRVMTIGGRLYPLHLAIAPDWKVHYFTAAMAEHPEHRAEEQRFLDDDLPATLGGDAVAALERVAATLGLDYGGIDFALDAAGRPVVFEANATMVILPPAAEERWEYRRPAIRRAIDAAQALLLGGASDRCG